jgi:hypothetical protein
MAAAEDTALVGTWDAQLTFTEGPRQGEHERLRWTFLRDGVIVGTDAEGGQLPPAVGEWAADGDAFSYWLNAVRNDAAGRPTTVVYGHAEGTVAADGHALTVSGGSEIYDRRGNLLATNRAEAHATRIRDGAV